MPDTDQLPTKKRKPVKPIRNFFKFMFGVKKWLPYEEVSSNTKNFFGVFSKLIYRRPKEIRKETYEEAVVRLQLTPEKLVERKKNFLHSAIIFAVFALGFLVYFIYLVINFRVLAACLTLLLVVVMSLSAYREHLWYMQMHKKKLGCGFHDWLAFILRRPLK